MPGDARECPRRDCLRPAYDYDLQACITIIGLGLESITFKKPDTLLVHDTVTLTLLFTNGYNL